MRNSLLLVCPLLAAAGITSVKGQQQPNIIFIMADDLGYSDLGVTGSDFYQTPNIDRLASQGVRFTQACTSAANSAPSRACLMSGMYTPRHGIYTVSPSTRGRSQDRKLIPITNTDDLRPSFVTMAEALHNQDYLCAQIGKWHLGDDRDGSGTGPLSQGFDFNVAGERAGSPYSYFYPYCNRAGKCHLGLEEGVEGEYLTDRLTTEAIKFMEANAGGDKPLFVYLSHHAVHVPLVAPDSLVKKYEALPKGKRHNNATYAAMIESLDTNVGRVMSAVDRLGIADNTVFVFFSDNGGTDQATDNYPLRGSKGTPYQGGINVPLIIRWPRVIEAGTVCNKVINGIDFYPTFVHVAGGTVADNLDGEDIFDIMQSDVQRDLFWFFPAYLEAYRQVGNQWRATPYATIRSGDMKLIRFFEDEHFELFDLAADPSEQHDLTAERPDVVEALSAKLQNWIEQTNAPVPHELNPEYVAY